MSAVELPTIGHLADHAAVYARGGLQIFPVNPADKRPLISQHQATCSIDVLAEWWGRWPTALIGHRLDDHTIILDIDLRHGGDKTWHAIRDEIGLPVTRTHWSGRGDGGGHTWWQRPPGKLSVTKLDAWAKQRGAGAPIKTRWTCGVDLLTREHRYTILPPSPHPDTGQPYRWKDAGPNTPCAPLPAALVDLLAAPEPPAPSPAATNGHAPADVDSIADWYTTHTTWNDLLAPNGWTRIHGDGDTDGSLWRHPTATTDHSASIRHGCLFIHSTSTVFEPTAPSDPHGYTRFHAYAVLAHGGDRSAAARAAREKKDGPGTPRVDLHDLIDTSTTGQAELPLGHVTEPWPDPQPLVTIDVPDFPLDALPPWIADHCDAVAEQLQVPVDLCAQLALGCLATIAMGHARVHPRADWDEPVNLYLATVMPSGAGKSPADRAIVGPLRIFEQQLIDLTAKERAEAELTAKIAHAQAKKAHDAAAKGEGTDELRHAALAAQAAADAVEEPPDPRLLASDATPEMVAVLLDRHAGRLAIVSTEAELYDIVLGPYGNRVNLSVFLKGWSGDEVIVDRKGGSGSPGTALRIPEALLTVSITVQPGALEALRGKPELTSRGFVPRFMHSWPQSLVGARDFLRPTPRIITHDTYTARLCKLGHQLHSWALPVDLRYDQAASTRFLHWCQAIEKRLIPGGDLEHLAEFTAKLRGSTARTAALLHLADDQRAAPITLDTIERAITIGDYWLAHADAMAARWGLDAGAEGAARILTWLHRDKPEQFTRNTVAEAHRRRFYRVADVDPCLELLVQRGWIRIIGEQKARSRQPIAIHEPHPWAITDEP